MNNPYNYAESIVCFDDFTLHIFNNTDKCVLMCKGAETDAQRKKALNHIMQHNKTNTPITWV